jgi:hypothetical protein
LGGGVRCARAQACVDGAGRVVKRPGRQLSLEAMRRVAGCVACVDRPACGGPSAWWSAEEEVERRRLKGSVECGRLAVVGCDRGVREAVARPWAPARPGLSLLRDRAGAEADG